jgi:hypothetical protein
VQRDVQEKWTTHPHVTDVVVREVDPEQARIGFNRSSDRLARAITHLVVLEPVRVHRRKKKKKKKTPPVKSRR